MNKYSTFHEKSFPPVPEPEGKTSQRGRTLVRTGRLRESNPGMPAMNVGMA